MLGGGRVRTRRWKGMVRERSDRPVVGLCTREYVLVSDDCNLGCGMWLEGR